MIRAMEKRAFQPPTVLVFAGLDPTGGAGIQADIETIASLGGHAAPVITATTVQDTSRVRGFTATEPKGLLEQAYTVLSDMPVASCKIGLVPSSAVAQAIHTVLKDYPELPVVIDPVLTSGAGDDLVVAGTRHALRSALLPRATVVTPNSIETRALAPEAESLDAAAAALMSLGTKFVLVTGTHEDTAEVVNTVYANGRRVESFNWKRLGHDYHGSGCTLASAIGALLAQGLEPLTAIGKAQEYTWQSLRHGYLPGKGQHLPDRFFWARGRQRPWQ